MMAWYFTLVNRPDRYRKFMLFCILLNLMFFAWRVNFKDTLILAGLIISIFLLIIHFFKRRQMLKLPQHIFLIVFVLIWSFAMEWLPALLNIVFTGSAIYLKKAITMTVNESGIRIHSFPEKFFAWAEAENVLIRHGLFTIDLKNNRLIQFAVEGEADEGRFNLFCSQQLMRGTTQFL